MKTIWRRSLALTGGLAMATSMSVAACGSWNPPHERGGLAIVAGGRSNMPKLQLTGAAMKMHDEAVLSGDDLFIVGVSGSPEVLYSEQIENDCDDETTCDAVLRDYRIQTEQLLAATAAKAAEADTLGAIVLAARSLTAVTGSGPRRILVIDNGLQTAGDMPLQSPGALSVDPKIEAADLSGADKLRDLKDVEILFTGLGARFDPQTKLSSTALSKLEALWTTVLEGGGARVTIDRAPLAEDRPAGTALPAVTVVAGDDQITPTGTGCFRIRADQVGFKPDQAEFVDANAARKVLEPIALELKEKNVKANVIGTTAYPEADPIRNPLSHARAEAVVKVLVQLGVPRSLLLPDGVGIQFAGYRNPVQNGKRNELIAVQNRLVIISPVGASCPA
jgi:outer membrane protein OmpA-like peptidoglycan-associated protein